MVADILFLFSRNFIKIDFPEPGFPWIHKKAMMVIKVR